MIDFTAFRLSLLLAAATVVVLMPLALLLARALAYRRFPGRNLVEAAVTLPLVLPPTVLGFYLLVAFAPDSPLGAAFARLAGHTLVFSFEGLVLGSVIANLPFAVQPMQRGFEAIAPDIREAAACAGMPPWRAFWRVELPLAWPGIVSALALTFAHTLGEFGVVLMLGGNIPGETRTAAIAIYDRTQAFDYAGAGAMSAMLLALCIVALAVTYGLATRVGRRHG